MDEPEYAWRYEARCSGQDTDIFYPPRDKEQYKDIADKAKAFCFGETGKTIVQYVPNVCGTQSRETNLMESGVD